MVRSSVEETLNWLLDAEADSICRAQRYERSPERVDTRAGHYERRLGTKAGEQVAVAAQVVVAVSNHAVVDGPRSGKSGSWQPPRRSAAASSAPASSFTPARPIQTPGAAHAVAWSGAHRPGWLLSAIKAPALVPSADRN